MNDPQIIETVFLNSIKDELSKESFEFYKYRMRNIPKHYHSLGLSKDSSLYTITDAEKIDAIIEIVKHDYQKYSYSKSSASVLRKYADFLRCH